MMNFEKNPKMPRLYRDITITEKIDGTHGAIFIEEGPFSSPIVAAAGSRNRIITPGKSTDNFGFAGWVAEHADALACTLGIGVHRGEWWGAGIQRRYDMDHKRFSLFATHRWAAPAIAHIEGLDVVPVLYRGPYTDDVMRYELDQLELLGSAAKPCFMQPEGIVMYHEASKQLFKYTRHGDGHKSHR